MERLWNPRWDSDHRQSFVKPQLGFPIRVQLPSKQRTEIATVMTTMFSRFQKQHKITTPDETVPNREAKPKASRKESAELARKQWRLQDSLALMDLGIEPQKRQRQFPKSKGLTGGHLWCLDEFYGLVWFIYNDSCFQLVMIESQPSKTIPQGHMHPKQNLVHGLWFCSVTHESTTDPLSSAAVTTYSLSVGMRPCPTLQQLDNFLNTCAVKYVQVGFW